MPPGGRVSLLAEKVALFHQVSIARTHRDVRTRDRHRNRTPLVASGNEWLRRAVADQVLIAQFRDDGLQGLGKLAGVADVKRSASSQGRELRKGWRSSTTESDRVDQNVRSPGAFQGLLRGGLAVAVVSIRQEDQRA